MDSPQLRLPIGTPEGLLKDTQVIIIITRLGAGSG